MKICNVDLSLEDTFFEKPRRGGGSCANTGLVLWPDRAVPDKIVFYYRLAKEELLLRHGSFFEKVHLQLW